MANVTVNNSETIFDGELVYLKVKCKIRDEDALLELIKIYNSIIDLI